MAQYTVRIKDSCPRDTYTRNSIRFVKYEWRNVDEADVTDEMRADPFLELRRVGPAPKPDPLPTPVDDKK